MDLAAVAALLLWTPREREPHGEMARTEPSRPIGSYGLGVLLSIVVFASVSGAVVMAGFRSAMLAEDGTIVGPGEVVVLEPTKWVGKRFPLLPFIEDLLGPLKPGERPLRERLAEGDWIVVLYHHDCPECRKAIPKYAELARQTAADANGPRVALVEVPPFGDANAIGVSLDAEYVCARLSDEKEWFVESPMEIEMRRGVIAAIRGRTESSSGSADGSLVCDSQGPVDSG